MARPRTHRTPTDEEAREIQRLRAQGVTKTRLVKDYNTSMYIINQTLAEQVEPKPSVIKRILNALTSIRRAP